MKTNGIKNIPDKDNDVQLFLERENQAIQDENRELKMQNVAENRELRRDFFRLLSGSKQLKRFKDSFLMQTSRRYTEDGSYIPKPFAKTKTKEQKILGYFAESVIETQYEWSELNLVYNDGFESSKTDGDFALWLQYRDGTVVPEKVDISDIVIDPHCTNFNAGPGTYDSYDWIIIKRVYSYEEGLEEAKRLSGEDMRGIIQPGEPTAAHNITFGVPTTDKGKKQGTTLETEDIHFRFAYDIKKGHLVVYAGSNSVLLMKESIKFKSTNKKGKKIKQAPLVFFSFSKEKIGPYSAGLFDLAKDITANYQEVLDKAFLHFKKTVNPLIFLFTDAGAEMLEQIEVAYQNQEYGGPPTILAPATDNTQVKTIAPESIIGQLKEYRALALEDLAGRLGLNLQQQANLKQTYSEYREKNDIEVLAIANYVTINRVSFSKTAQFTLDMEREYGDRNSQETVEVKIPIENGKVEIAKITYGEALALLDDYKGTFDIDTNIKLPSTVTDQVFALNEIAELLLGQIGNQAITDMKIARPIIDIIWEKMKVRDLDEIIGRVTLEEFFESIVSRNTGGQSGQESAAEQNKQDIVNQLQGVAPNQPLVKEGSNSIL